MADDTFYDRVYEVVRLIPTGRLTSYGAIAAFLGARSSSRMVGYAMNNAGAAFPPVPAHRVLNRNGLLTGKHHFKPNGLMQELLESEGIKVEDDRAVDFKKLYWDPTVELGFE